MKIDEIKTIVKLMSDNDLTEFKIESEEMTLCLRRAARQQTAPAPVFVPTAVPAAASPVPISAAIPAVATHPHTISHQTLFRILVSSPLIVICL